MTLWRRIYDILRANLDTTAEVQNGRSRYKTTGLPAHRIQESRCLRMMMRGSSPGNHRLTTGSNTLARFVLSSFRPWVRASEHGDCIEKRVR